MSTRINEHGEFVSDGDAPRFLKLRPVNMGQARADAMREEAELAASGGRDALTRVCVECGREFEARVNVVTCSPECRERRERRMRYENQRRKRGGRERAPRACSECGREFVPIRSSQVACSPECRAARKRRQNRESKGRMAR